MKTSVRTILQATTFFLLLLSITRTTKGDEVQNLLDLFSVDRSGSEVVGFGLGGSSRPVRPGTLAISVGSGPVFDIEVTPTLLDALGSLSVSNSLPQSVQTTPAGSVNIFVPDNTTVHRGPTNINNDSPFLNKGSVETTGSFTNGSGGLIVGSGNSSISSSSFSNQGKIVFKSGANGQIKNGPLINQQTGVITIGSGASLSLTGGSFSNFGSTTVTGGSLSNSNDFKLSNGGSFNLVGGGTATTADDGYIGNESGGDLSTVAISGANSRWTVSDDLTVGNGGAGLLTISTGGRVTSAEGRVGGSGQSGSTGLVNITGTNSRWNNSSNLLIGNSNTGTLSIEQGGLVTSSNVGVIGNTGSASGLVNIDGQNSHWNHAGELRVGASGSGTLGVANGGRVSSIDAMLGSGSLGNGARTGTATIDGEGSRWTNTNSMFVGGSSSSAGGTGTLNITNEGQVETGGVVKLWNNGTLNLNGGTLKADTLDPSAGTFNWTDGRLNVDNYVGSLTQNAGTLAAGNSPGTTVITGDYTLNSGGTLEVELAGPDGVPGVDFDFYDVAGAANLHGLLDINLIGGYFGELGKSFDVLTASSIDTSGMTLSESVFSKSIVAGGNGVLLRITQDSELVLDWNNTLGGSFQSTANWNPAIAPNSIHTTRYNTPGQTYTVDFSADTNNLRAIHKTGDVTLDLAGNTYTLTNPGATTSSLSVGDVSGDNASLTVAGGTLATQHIRIGENSSTGAFNVDTTGIVTAVETRIGSGGTLNLNGGSLTTGSLDNTNGGTLNHNNGTITIDGGTFTPATNDFTIDGVTPSDMPTFELKAGATSSITSTLVVGGIQKGALVVDGADSSWTADRIRIGQFGDGVVTVSNGASVDSGLQSFVGSGAVGNATSGMLTVDGVGSTWTTSGEMFVAFADMSNGTLNITGGGSASNTLGYIGTEANSTGVVTVDGVGSTWTNGDNLYVGQSGNGILNITNGGLVNIGANLWVGDESTAAGTVNISGTVNVLSGKMLVGNVSGSNGIVTVSGATASLTTATGLEIGVSGDGDLIVNNGATVISNTMEVARNSGTTGNVQVDGLGTSLALTGDTYIGGKVAAPGGAGSLAISDGATVTNAAAYIESDGISTSSVTVDGVGSIWTSSGFLHVGELGTATLSITNGGTVSNIGQGRVGKNVGSTGTVLVDGSGSTWANSGDLHVGDAGDGTLTISGSGSVSSSRGKIAVNSVDAVGFVSVVGAGSMWTNSSTFHVGSRGDGTLNVSGGGSVSNTEGSIGRFTNSTGAVTVDGTGSTWTNSTRLLVGNEGDGTLDISNGGSVIVVQDSLVSEASSSTSIVTVDGVSSTLTITEDLSVGKAGNGTLNIQNGGNVSNSIGQVGRETGSTGTVNVTGESSTWNNTSLLVGNNGNATLNVTAGGSVISDAARIGDNTNSTGTVLVDGVGSTWTSTNTLTLGGDDTTAGGTGTLTITNSGAVTVANTAKLWSGSTVNLQGGTLETGMLDVPEATFDNTWTSGTLRITNSGVTITPGSGPFGNALSLGANQRLELTSAAGDMAVNNGSTVNVNGGTAIFSTLSVDGSSSFNFTAGTVRYTGSDSLDDLVKTSSTLADSQHLEVIGAATLGLELRLNGGMLSVGSIDAASAANLDFDAGTLNITDSNLVVGVGGTLGNAVIVGPSQTINLPSNSVTVDADANLNLIGGNFTASEATNNGLLLISNTTNVDFDSDDSGTGLTNNGELVAIDSTIAGMVTNNGAIELVGTVDFTDGLTLAASGSLSIDLNGLANFDAIQTDGDVLLSGLLDVDAGNYSPTVGDSFEILTAIGSVNGVFDSVALPSLSAGLLWDLDYGSNDVLLSVVTAYPSDFDLDGDVDGDDLTDPTLGWQARYGNDLDGSNFLAWQRELGSGVAGLASSSATVPEPSTLLLGAIACCGFFLRRNRKECD